MVCHYLWLLWSRGELGIGIHQFRFLDLIGTDYNKKRDRKWNRSVSKIFQTHICLVLNLLFFTSWVLVLAYSYGIERQIMVRLFRVLQSFILTGFSSSSNRFRSEVHGAQLFVSRLARPVLSFSKLRPASPEAVHYPTSSRPWTVTRILVSVPPRTRETRRIYLLVLPRCWWLIWFDPISSEQSL